MEEKQKFPKATEVLSQAPRRDPYSPEHGSGNPHMNSDENPLSESKIWQSHRSHGTAKPKKK